MYWQSEKTDWREISIQISLAFAAGLMGVCEQSCLPSCLRPGVCVRIVCLSINHCNVKNVLKLTWVSKQTEWCHPCLINGGWWVWIHFAATYPWERDNTHFRKLTMILLMTELGKISGTRKVSFYKPSTGTRHQISPPLFLECLGLHFFSWPNSDFFMARLVIHTPSPLLT